MNPAVPRYALNLPRKSGGTTSPIHTMTVGRTSPWLIPNRAAAVATTRLSAAWQRVLKATVHNAAAMVTMVR